MDFFDQDDDYKVVKKVKLNASIALIKVASPQEDTTKELADLFENDSSEDKKDNYELSNVEQNKKLDEIIGVDHYDRKKDMDEFDRRGLKTINLRNFHNWIKAVLLNKYTRQLKNDTKDYKLKISGLDFGCGKGGDLKKWKECHISNLVGIDISATAVEDARKRWETSRYFKAKFINVSGGEDEETFFNQIDSEMYFDIVSSQFVLHYLFEDEHLIRNGLNNITKKLVKGGYFICTIPDANVMVKRVRSKGVKTEDGSMILGNEYYSVRFESMSFPKDKIYGLKYGFFLNDAVGSKQKENEKENITYVSEYVVIFENFIKLARSYGLELVEDKNFHEFLKENVKNPFYHNLLARMELSDFSKMEKGLWEVSYLYKAVVFKKVTGPYIKSVPRNF